MAGIGFHFPRPVQYAAAKRLAPRFSSADVDTTQLDNLMRVYFPTPTKFQGILLQIFKDKLNHAHNASQALGTATRTIRGEQDLVAAMHLAIHQMDGTDSLSSIFQTSANQVYVDAAFQQRDDALLGEFLAYEAKYGRPVH